MQYFYEKLNIPENCIIVERTDFKETLLKNIELLSSDKKIINEHIKKVILKYNLTPNTINILPFRSDERDYLEIEVIEVQLNEISKIKRIAEIIMRAIPYPILLIFVNKSQIQLVTGDMRKSLSNSSKVTVDDFVFTDWIDLEVQNKFSSALFDSLDITKLSYANFYEMYKDITAKLDIYNISKTKGELINKELLSGVDIKEIYNKIKSIELKISQLQSRAKNKIDIAESVEISVELNKLQKEKELLKSKI